MRSCVKLFILFAVMQQVMLFHVHFPPPEASALVSRTTMLPRGQTVKSLQAGVNVAGNRTAHIPKDQELALIHAVHSLETPTHVRINDRDSSGMGKAAFYRQDGGQRDAGPSQEAFKWQRQNKKQLPSLITRDAIYITSKPISHKKQTGGTSEEKKGADVGETRDARQIPNPVLILETGRSQFYVPHRGSATSAGHQEITIIEEYTTQTKVGEGETLDDFAMYSQVNGTVESDPSNKPTDEPTSEILGIIPAPPASTTPMSNVQTTPQQEEGQDKKEKKLPKSTKNRRFKKKKSQPRKHSDKEKHRLTTKLKGNFTSSLQKNSSLGASDRTVKSPSISPAPAPHSVDDESEGSGDMPDTTQDTESTNMRPLVSTADWQLLRTLTASQFSWVDVIIAVSVSVAALLILINCVVLVQYYAQRRQPLPPGSPSTAPNGAAWCVHVTDLQAMKPAAQRMAAKICTFLQQPEPSMEPRPTSPVPPQSPQPAIRSAVGTQYESMDAPMDALSPDYLYTEDEEDEDEERDSACTSGSEGSLYTPDYDTLDNYRAEGTPVTMI